MKATIVVSDETGTSYRGTVELVPFDAHKLQNVGGNAAIHGSEVTQIDFSLPMRLFVRKYASRTTGGAARFTVLLAYMARGNSRTEVPAEELEATWKRLTAHLGSFNRAHSTRAKDRGWMDSSQFGKYRLGPLWHEAFLSSNSGL